MLGLIAAGAGVVRAGVGMIQANQEKQRQKGIIGRAYKLGKQRLDLRQGDVRQNVTEGLLSRGLGQGGGVRMPDQGAAPALTGSVGDARDLGSQAMADLSREQGLEAYGLEQEKNNAYSDTKAGYNSAVVNSIGAGINTAASVYGMGKDAGALSAMRTNPAAGVGQGVQVDAPPPGWNPTRYPGTYRGIDPINPAGRSMATTADFNKFSAQNVG